MSFAVHFVSAQTAAAPHPLGDPETDLPDDDWDTLGGLVFNTLGHVPVEGDHIVTHGWRFTVREMEGRRIKQVEVTREVDAAEGELVDADS